MRVRGVSWRWGIRLCLRDLQVRVPKVCRLLALEASGFRS